MQDHGTPDEAAAMAVFIASEEAGSFTGQDVNTPRRLGDVEGTPNAG